MKKATTLLFLPLLLAVSCAGPIIIAGMGAAVGIWTYDDFTNDRGQIIINASAHDVFAVSRTATQARPNAKDFEITNGTMRIEFLEDKAQVAVQVMMMPETPQFCTLKVYAAELGIRGRAELAQAVAEDIASRF